MNPKKILLSIPLASLLVLTPNVSASPVQSEYESTQRQYQDPVLAALDAASTVEEERAMFRELVERQAAEEAADAPPAYAPPADAPTAPSSWWSEFNRFLVHTDIQDLLNIPTEDYLD